MSDSVECVVIGAGVVGLAIGRHFAMAGMETVILESESHIGTGTSSRNSEVIHAGIHYAPGSLKAKLCVAGKQMLYDYCRDRRVEHSNCGKLIVATNTAQLDSLSHVVNEAALCGVDDLELFSGDQAREMEPELECVGAIWSPSTGIVDSHGLMVSLLGDFEAAGGMLAVKSPVVRGFCSPDGITLRTGGESEAELRTRYVVNAAGLNARDVALAMDGLEDDVIPDLYFAKGNYYSLDHRPPFSRLIYPVPDGAHLGVHLTLDLGGRARFGPDHEWADDINYDVDPAGAAAFYAAIREYWPGLTDDSLSPAYSGIRPKVQAPGDPPRDFCIHGADEHGVPGLVNLFGIESPGLTASLAIASFVRDECLRLPGP
jgi:L-2-hydroxyglutarate oxidase LhgO